MTQPTMNETKLTRSFELDRDPSNYEATTHVLQRIRERGVIDYELLAETIEGGSVVDSHNNDGHPDEAVVLRYQWLQSTIEVVVCPNDRVIQTAYEVTA